MDSKISDQAKLVETVHGIGGVFAGITRWHIEEDRPSILMLLSDDAVW